jgi:sterol desaturase/sphingolipid hydroxylase (fatty acid hydroxylase superfamily)
MKPEVLAILAIYGLFIIAEIIFTRFFNKPAQVPGDGIVESTSTVVLLLVTQPFIIATTSALGLYFFPDYQNALADIPVIAGVLLLLVFDDMMQYWWHRLSHTIPWLYKLHRPHHNAGYMSVRLVYRNNLFYYLMMPGIWFSGILIYMGLGWIYAFYLVVKLTVIIGAHCDIAWDRPLYKIKALSPLMWLVERTISTPATHHAHHGKYKADGITNYKGNYGNLLFFWDILFGTAKITRQYPKEFGVENLPDTSVAEQLLWPLISTSEMPRESSEPSS